MSKNILVIFGAPDPEEKSARALAIANGAMTATATAPDKEGNAAPVHASNAYAATGYQIDNQADATNITPQTEVVLFECGAGAGNGFEKSHTCDHHMPGHPGFGRPAAEAVEASSLGQLANYLGATLNQEQRTIGAMDHNLRGAYNGETQGVDSSDVLALRAAELAKRSGLSLDDAKAELTRVIELLQNTKPLENGVVDLRPLGVNAFIGDASAMTGIPAIGFQDSRSPNKLNLCNPTSAQAEAFMADWGTELGLEAEGRYNARGLVCGGNVAAN